MKLRKLSILVVNSVSSCVSFFHTELELEHFILRFNKMSQTLQIPLKEGIGGVTGGPKTG